MPHNNAGLNSDIILTLLRERGRPISKRDMARHFGLKGGQRIALKRILSEMEERGEIEKSRGQTYSLPQSLPAVCMIEVSEITEDGDLLAAPLEKHVQDNAEDVTIHVEAKGKHKDVSVGTHALARLTRIDAKTYTASIMRTIDKAHGQILGLVQRTSKGFVLKPTARNAKQDFDIDPNDMNGAKKGDLATGMLLPSRGLRRRKVRITEVVGTLDDPNAISMISMYEAGLRAEFPKAVTKETKDLKVPPLGKREDLRDIPLVTIDGADAKDFDDAVWAEKTSDGYHLIVAIADVAYYVRPSSKLNEEAYRRGNSTYFPDRVVPMLPEALSNDLCSLRPNEDRASMAMHLWIDEHGTLLKYKPVRALIRSAARLIYEDVQAIYDGTDHPLKENIRTLYDVYNILLKAREKRGALDLDLPEYQVLLDDKNRMTGIKKRSRLDAHKLIEEFMILANVAAAKALEDKKAPCVYRIHARPKPEKLDSVREFLESFGLSLPKGQVIKPKQINQLLHKAEGHEYSELISTTILRTQSQANYSPDNEGHFGLALEKYAHFTSPIRRYADLLVHRSLVKAYKLGEGGLSDEEDKRLNEMAEHISEAERISVDAERKSIDRFKAAFLSSKIGGEFTGKISGVTNFGLFVTLDETGADGLLPMRSLGREYFHFDADHHTLSGKQSGQEFRLGQAITVRLAEAEKLSGSLIFEYPGANEHPMGRRPKKRFKKPRNSKDRKDKAIKSEKKKYRKKPKG